MGGSVLPSAPQSCPLLLVDGHNLLWRATFGFPAPVYSRDKQRTLTGLFGFFALLRVAVRDNFEMPPEIVVVFDGEFGSTDRRDTDAGYKAQRPEDDQALAPIRFLPDVKRGLDATGLAWIELERAEADDVIAALVRVAASRPVVIMSGDRDYYQLVNSHVTVLNTAMRQGHRHIGPEQVFSKYGVTPAQWADFRALAGDPADNIPGVPGIGAKTAAALLADGATLDTLPSTGRLATGRGRAVAAHLDLARKYRAMIALDREIAVPVAPTGAVTAELPSARHVLERIDAW